MVVNQTASVLNAYGIVALSSSSFGILLGGSKVCSSHENGGEQDADDDEGGEDSLFHINIFVSFGYIYTVYNRKTADTFCACRLFAFAISFYIAKFLLRYL